MYTCSLSILNVLIICKRSDLYFEFVEYRTFYTEVMASKIDKLVCDKLNQKQRYIEESKVCAKNIFVLSNNDVKTVLSKYSSLSSKEKEIVKRFSDDLQMKHVNRYRNLSKFFKQAFDSDKPVKNNNGATVTASVSITEKNDSKIVKVTIPTNIKSERELETNKLSTNNNSVPPYVKQESTTPPFHTNIISRVNNNNNIVNINPLYSTIFPKIHQKVINQCFSSKVIMNNAINNITAVLNLTQNVNPSPGPVNTSQQKSPCESQSIDKSEKRNSDLVERNETGNTNKSQNTSNNQDKDSKNHQESKNNQIKKEATTKNTSVQKSNSLIQINSNNTKEPEKIQDLESFSLEHMKKIETFAQHSPLKHSIKFNLSSNSQIKISETYNKTKHPESQVIDVNDVKQCFNDTTTNLYAQQNNKIEMNIIRTSYDDADKRLIEHSRDNLKNDQRNIKSKVVKNVADVHESKEKCKLYSNQKREPSNSDFLDECNRLKSMLSKNSNVPENISKKEEMKVIVTRKPKKRNKNKYKYKYKKEVCTNLKLIKLDNQLVSNETVVLEEKPEIVQPEVKNIISSENDLVKENVEVTKKKPQNREVKVVNRVLRSDCPNDQIIKSISEKPFTEECNKITNVPVLVTKQDIKCKLDKMMDTKDLMVLLKYFYKLDGMEQHRLIEFLKELELTEPERVADLRKHVRTSPPEDEENTALQIPQPDADPVELVDRPESRNSDLSNIDLILEDIDSILNDEDNDESPNKEESVEPPSKRLKTNVVSDEVVRNDRKSESNVSFETAMPMQFQNSENFTFNQNNYGNNTHFIQYNNMMQQNIDYVTQYQNYGYNNQNQYFQNNFQQAYQLNTTQLFIQNQQNFNNFNGYQNFGYNYNNQMGQYQQNYSNYQNDEYF